MRRLLGILSFVFAGAFFIVFSYLLWLRVAPNRLSFASNFDNTVNHENPGESTPSTITIEELNIRLPVVSVELSDGKWPQPTSAVAYLSTSARPGKTGNSIIYGHNWPNLLGNLHKAKRGQKIRIEDSKNRTMEYEIMNTLVVTPDQTHILSAVDEKRLTIYTCIGFFDTKRFVVVARLLEV